MIETIGWLLDMCSRVRFWRAGEPKRYTAPELVQTGLDRSGFTIDVTPLMRQPGGPRWKSFTRQPADQWLRD